MHDDQLIFMISLPRSGSTMLQKILGGHSEIYTRSEPWLMLHPLHALKSKHVQTRYNASLAEAGVRDFISGLPEDGEGFYYQRLRECYLSMYEPYLQSSGKNRFLDKTPRYYEVFDELQLTFPNAKFIILYRNPLAVLASMLDTWIKGNYERLKDYRSDLEQGVEFLQRDFSGYSNTHLIRYEELLAEPEGKLEELFRFLQLPNQSECVQYGKAPAEKWLYGDPTTVYAKDHPDSTHADIWLKQLASPEPRKLLLDYLQKLGKPSFDRLGYSFEDAKKAFADAEQQYPQEGHLNLSLLNLLRTDEEHLAQIRRQNAKLNKNIQDLQEEKRELEKTLSEGQALLKLKDLRFDEYNRLLADKELTAKESRVLLEYKDQRLEELSRKLNELAEMLACQEQAVRTAEEENISAKNNLVELNRGLEALRQILSQKEQELDEKNKKCIQIEVDSEVLETQFSALLSALKELTEYRAVLSPWEKVRAYKRVLQEYLFLRDILKLKI